MFLLLWLLRAAIAQKVVPIPRAQTLQVAGPIDEPTSIELRSALEIPDQGEAQLPIIVEPRAVSIDEVPRFREVGACGTATVMAPIASITDGDVKHEWHKHEVLTSLREHLQQVQLGEAEDKHGWMREVQM